MSCPASVEDEQPKSWLFSKEEILTAPSVKNGVAVLEEQTVRKISCKFIAEIGQNLMHPASIIAINSAKVFLNRYYMMEPMDTTSEKSYQHKLVGITCLFVACKTEECLRPLKEFIWAWNHIDADLKRINLPFGRYEGEDTKRKIWQIDEETPKYQEVREHILHCERILLHVLGFDFQVDHPHAYIMRFVRFFDTAKRDKESRALVLSSADDRFTEFGVLILTTANAMANDSTSTTLGIQFKASSVAAACVSLALKTQGFKSLSLEKWSKKWNEERSAEKESRFQTVNITKEEQEDVCNQLLDLYDEIQRQNAEAAQRSVVPEPAPTTAAHACGAALSDAKPPAGSAPAAAAAPAQLPPAKGSAAPSSDKREKLEQGEPVLMPGSGPKPYLLQRKDKVYSCTCSIWKHIDDIEQRRTCKHLRQLRGEKAETGRVGEDGIRKSDEKLKELLEADAKLRQMHAGQAGPAGTCSSLGKRPMEAADAAAVKKPHMP